MDDNDVERRVTAKVAWRFVPFLVLCYFVAYLDRVNVGFAKLTMDADIGITDTMFGFGAGVFFLAYFLFEVPSNLAARPRRRAALDRAHHVLLGPDLRRDGLHSGDRQGDRLQRRTHILLPARAARLRRGGVLPRHHLLPDAVVPRRLPRPHHRLLHGGDPALLGARLAGLRCAARARRRARLQGWQWLFIAEAAPALVLAVVTYFYLTDRPADAHWLDDRRARLAGRPARRRGQGARQGFARQRAAQPLRPARARRLADLFRRRRLRFTASASGCRRSSRASACRSRSPAGSPPFPTLSASSA